MYSFNYLIWGASKGEYLHIGNPSSWVLVGLLLLRKVFMSKHEGLMPRKIQSIGSTSAIHIKLMPFALEQEATGVWLKGSTFLPASFSCFFGVWFTCLEISYPALCLKSKCPSCGRITGLPAGLGRHCVFILNSYMCTGFRSEELASALDCFHWETCRSPFICQKETRVLPSLAFTPWSSPAEPFLVGEVETGSL